MKNPSLCLALAACAFLPSAHAATGLPICLSVDDTLAHRLYVIADDANLNPMTYLQEPQAKAVRITEYQNTYDNDREKRFVLNSSLVGVANIGADGNVSSITAGGTVLVKNYDQVTESPIPMSVQFENKGYLWNLARSANVSTQHYLSVVPCTPCAN